jgi:hypothetical protein
VYVNQSTFIDLIDISFVVDVNVTFVKCDVCQMRQLSNATIVKCDNCHMRHLSNATFVKCDSCR